MKAAILLVGALAMVVGPIHFDSARAVKLAPLSTASRPLGSGSFRADATYPTIDAVERPDGIATLGSWLGSDAFEGVQETAWFRARSEITILLAGYPSRAPNRFEVDVQDRDGGQRTIAYAGADPGEAWRPWRVHLAARDTAVRIRAVDASGAAKGWLAFSEPFSAIEGSWIGQTWGLVQLVSTACLAFALLYGPGLVWVRARAQPERDLAFAILPGPLLVASLGAMCWAGGRFAAPSLVAYTGVGLLLLWLAWQTSGRRGGPPLPKRMTAVITAGALVAGFAIAKANVSTGPAGELYGGTVSRTLEVGLHSDSRISYHVVQVVAHAFAPFSADASIYFAPWTFGSRGPLAGLLAAPIVLATGAAVPRDFPDQPWRPFDSGGFAAYRIALIVLASLAGWAIFGAVATVASGRYAVLASVIALLAPFFVHELYFTWPKMMAAGLTLAAFLFAVRRQPFASGAMLGLAYLTHPLPVLSTPFFLLWIAGAREVPVRRRVERVAWFLGGLAALVAPWQALNWFGTGGLGSQSIFVTYWTWADGGPAAWYTGAWWHSRWENFANTFLPFYLLRIDPHHYSINAVGGLSDGWVHAGFLYWNTLPFALGLPAFVLLVAGIAANFRTAVAATLVVVIGPALLLVFYWGAMDSGLMRHCGQVLFVSVIVFGVWALARDPDGWPRPALRAFCHPFCFAWRGVEIVIMAFGTTVVNRYPNWTGPLLLNDAASCIIAVLCVTAAVIILYRSALAERLDDLQERPALNLR
jgi:hypothetical protein